MGIQEIPLLAQNQTLAITLGGIDYQMAVPWREAPQGGWFLDLSDANGVPRKWLGMIRRLTASWPKNTASLAFSASFMAVSLR